MSAGTRVASQGTRRLGKARRRRTQGTVRIKGIVGRGPECGGRRVFAVCSGSLRFMRSALIHCRFCLCVPQLRASSTWLRSDAGAGCGRRCRSDATSGSATSSSTRPCSGRGQGCVHDRRRLFDPSAYRLTQLTQARPGRYARLGRCQDGARAAGDGDRRGRHLLLPLPRRGADQGHTLDRAVDRRLGDQHGLELPLERRGVVERGTASREFCSLARA